MPGNQRGTFENLADDLISTAKKCKDENIASAQSIEIIHGLRKLMCTAMMNGTYTIVADYDN